jgi:hypothetical protein
MRHAAMPSVYVGDTFVKRSSGRLAQVSARNQTHALMYWPDKDEETTVKLTRFNRESEWVPKERPSRIRIGDG